MKINEFIDSEHNHDSNDQKKDLGFNIAHDLHIHMKNDPMFYRKQYYPTLAKLQDTLKRGEPIDVKKELLPMEDRGAYLVIGFTDEGSSFEYTQEKAQVIEKRLIPLLQAENSPYSRFIMRVPGFGSSATSYNSFIIIALLDHWKNRKQDSQTVMRQAIGKIVTVPQAVAFPISPQSIRVSSYNKPVQMVIYGSTYEELERIQSEVIGKLRRNRNLSRIESDYSRNKPEVKLIINKNKAKDLGVSTETVGKSLETLYGGKRVTTFNRLGKEYPIILQQYL